MIRSIIELYIQTKNSPSWKQERGCVSGGRVASGTGETKTYNPRRPVEAIELDGVSKAKTIHKFIILWDRILHLFKFITVSITCTNCVVNANDTVFILWSSPSGTCSCMFICDWPTWCIARLCMVSQRKLTKGQFCPKTAFIYLFFCQSPLCRHCHCTTTWPHSNK